MMFRTPAVLLVVIGLASFDGSLRAEAQVSSTDGAHFCVASDRIYVIGNNGVILLDLATGKPVLSIPISKMTPIGPVYEGHSLIFATGGSYSTVEAIDGTHYRPEWTFDHRSSILQHHGGRIYLNNQLDNSLSAITAATGKAIWTSKNTRGQDYAFSNAIVTRDGRIVTNSGILSEKTGTALLQWPSRIVDATFSEDRLWILDETGTISELDGKNQVMWKSPTNGTVNGATRLLSEGDLLFIVEKPSGPGKSSLLAIRRSTHAQSWSLAGVVDDYRGALSISSGLVIIVTRDGRDSVVAGYDSHTGKLVWTNSISQPAESPTVAGNFVLLKTSDGICALRLSDGSPLWTYDEAARPGLTVPK